MAAAVHSVADGHLLVDSHSHLRMVPVDPPYPEVPEVQVDQVVPVQEDTEDQEAA